MVQYEVTVTLELHAQADRTRKQIRLRPTVLDMAVLARGKRLLALATRNDWFEVNFGFFSSD